MQKRKLLGQSLLEDGWLAQEDLDAALEEQRERGGRLGTILVGKRVVAERTLLETLSRQLDVDVVDIGECLEDPEAVSLLPYTVAKQYRALPLKKSGRVLHVAMAEPQDPDAVQTLQFATGMRIHAGLCSEKEIDIAIEQRYGMEEAVDKIVRNVAREAHLEDMDVASVYEDNSPVFNEEAGEKKGPSGPSVAPIVRLVHLILLEAVRKEASDIHLEPARRCLQIRFRLDGVLQRRMSVPRYLQQTVISRLKVMARMDIANKRTPQDGGIRLQADGRRLDLRVSSLPTYFGEKIVIRILDQTEKNVDLNTLGMTEKDRRDLESSYRKPQGMILVTGPTGSGKSTTLRCILKDLGSEGINIITVEDPVEYELEGINQVQIHTDAGLSFSGALRSILRQDPNVIMVGEIRDSETAEVAFRAALTGHLVLSTLHTNDTVSTITRLVDMGVPRFLISSALLAVVSQRLARKICSGCAQVDVLDPVRQGTLKKVTPPLTNPKIGKGCSRCEYTGYKGRAGIYELLALSSEIRERIARGATEGEIRRLARVQGMRTLAEDGLDKVRQGITSLGELSTVVSWGGFSFHEEGIPSSSPVEGQKESDSLLPSHRRIVLAEDDPGVREAVCLTLEALDCEVIPTKNGREAWEKVERHLPDLIITDIHMPVLDGYGLLKKIRSDLRTAFVPVILLTAKNRCEDRMKGFLLGGDDYIEKPFNHRELLVRAKRCLERTNSLRN